MLSPAYIDLKFAPSVELIGDVRRFVSQFYGVFVADEDTASQIGLATHELLENAIKYGIDGTTSLRIELSGILPDVSVRIAVTNRTTPDHLVVLRSIIAEMAAAPDATAFYHQVIRRSLGTRDGSGLGIPRLRAEAGMTMTLEEADGGVVTVVARRHLRKDPS